MAVNERGMLHRFVATTYNVWNTKRWDERIGPLESYLQRARPDILCLQELRPQSLDLIDATLTGHSRVEDEFAGWAQESNIYFVDALFAEVEHGAEAVGQAYAGRRLFWVRLEHKPSSSTVLVATIHLTHQKSERERTEGVSPRLGEIGRSIDKLDTLVHEGEPVLLMGDLNDSMNVIRRLWAEGYVDSFTGSGSPLSPTHPVRPTADGIEDGIPQCVDWQFHRGPVRSMGSYVGEYFLNDISPSDHRPVTTTYGLGDSQ